MAKDIGLLDGLKYMKPFLKKTHSLTPSYVAGPGHAHRLQDLTPASWTSASVHQGV